MAVSHIMCAVFKFRYSKYLVPDQMAGPWHSSEVFPSQCLPWAYTVPVITPIPQGSQTARKETTLLLLSGVEEQLLLENALAHNSVIKWDPGLQVLLNNLCLQPCGTHSLIRPLGGWLNPLLTCFPLVPWFKKSKLSECSLLGHFIYMVSGELQNTIRNNTVGVK